MSNMRFLEYRDINLQLEIIFHYLPFKLQLIFDIYYYPRAVPTTFFHKTLILYIVYYTPLRILIKRPLQIIRRVGGEVIFYRFMRKNASRATILRLFIFSICFYLPDGENVENATTIYAEGHRNLL